MPFVENICCFEHTSKVINRPPLILLHGAGGFHLSWPPEVRRIPGAHIYALDLPGHGQSPGTGRPTINEYADDVENCLRTLGMSQAVIAGYSMGSAIALTLALNYPDYVCGLILIGGGARLRVSPVILDGLRQPDRYLATVQLINDYSFAPTVTPRLKELSTQRMAATRQTVLINDFLASDSFDVSDRLGEINVPTLIICGAHDRMTPLRNSEFLHDGIANSRLEVVENAGHMAIFEQPGIMIDLIARFLDGFQ
ncbi:MAG: alpha/beta hydrolase [Chloroflexota bacterium]